MTVRLDRLLANLGYGSRSEVRALIQEGCVVMAGEPVTRADVGVNLSGELTDQLVVSGEAVDPPAPFTLMMNKPAGLVCSHDEPGRSVYDLLPERWRRRRPVLSTVGRLDADTTGLLLITDDGQLSHRITSPRHHLPKRYRVRLAEPLENDAGSRFASGELRLDGDKAPLAPARLTRLTATEVEIVVTEGRYHQVKRMFAAVGNRVLHLHRNQVGGLDLPSTLPSGAFRRLTHAEREALTP